MRIALIGQAAFGESVFNALRDAGEEIVAVSSVRGSADRPDPLYAAAKSAAVPVFSTGKLKQPDILEKYMATQPELAVMAFVTHILPEAVVEAPPKGTIEFHPSLLPLHRGRSAMHWAIRMGEDRTGVTVFWVDGGIDTGPLLLQREAPIDPDDTVGSLYFNKLFPLGIETLVESVRLVREGAAPRIAQDEARATYEPPADDSNSAIDWSQPARDVYNLVRGSNPQPGAHAMLRGERVRIFDCTLEHAEHDVAPGTIVGIADTIDVALAGGVLRVRRLQGGGGKLPAAEFAAGAGITQGDRWENGRA